MALLGVQVEAVIRQGGSVSLQGDRRVLSGAVSRAILKKKKSVHVCQALELRGAGEDCRIASRGRGARQTSHARQAALHAASQAGTTTSFESGEIIASCKSRSSARS